MAYPKELLQEEARIMKELEQFDTPTITNVVATYPQSNLCLGLYDPQEVDWYTDNSLCCLYPELGPRCGYAVTAVYGMPDPAFSRLEFKDILLEIAETEGPVILVLKENFSEKMKNRNAIIGGNMMTAFKQLGVTGVIGDAPARDVDEMRPLEVQCLFSGVTAGHGTMSIQAVNTPVNLCGMEVAPMEVIHMDENGAVKFPRKYLKQVLDLAEKTRSYDEEQQAAMRKTTDPVKIAEAMKGLYK